MDVSQLLPTFLGLLLVALMLWPIAKKLFFPYPTLLVIIGFVGSEWLVSRGIDTGLRWEGFRDLVYYVLLPTLIFEVAFSLNAEKLFKNLFSILMLGIPFMLLGVLITAVVIYLGIAHEAGFPFVAAIITAVVLSATAPSAITSILEHLNVSSRLISILEGEAIFNSVVAIILFTLLFQFIVFADNKLSFTDGFILFVRMFTGGLFLGMTVGALGLLATHWIKPPLFRGAISLLSAFGAYLLAEKYFQVSGLLAVLVTGLLFNATLHRCRQRIDKTSQDFMRAIWKYYAFFAKSMLFILLGISIQPSLLADQWLAIVIGIIASLIARASIVFIGLWLLGRLHKRDKFELQDKRILFWGDIKGAVTIALVLSLPSTLSYSYTIQGIIYGVVLFSLLIQAPTIRFLVPRRLSEN